MTADPPAELHTADFDYDLPPELIAQEPVAERGESRLLVVGGPVPADRTFGDFPSLVERGDLVVLNTTRVRHARLLGTRPSGAAAEVLLLHPTAEGRWLAMGKPGSALRPGKHIALGDCHPLRFALDKLYAAGGATGMSAACVQLINPCVIG